MLDSGILCLEENSSTALANVSPRSMFTSESSSGVVEFVNIIFITRFLIVCSSGTSSYRSSSKCIGASGDACQNRQSAQSMPSIEVPEFSPSTVISRPAPDPAPLLCPCSSVTGIVSAEEVILAYSNAGTNHFSSGWAMEECLDRFPALFCLSLHQNHGGTAKTPSSKRLNAVGLVRWQNAFFSPQSPLLYVRFYSVRGKPFYREGSQLWGKNLVADGCALSQRIDRPPILSTTLGPSTRSEACS
jgi:hypothetical protein